MDPIQTGSTDDWDAMMDINVKGLLYVSKAIIPGMCERKSGTIINIGSISGNQADPGMALYNASKAFVHGLTRSIAVDHGPMVRCNAIRPGWIMTDRQKDLWVTPEALAKQVTAEAKSSSELSRGPDGVILKARLQFTCTAEKLIFEMRARSL